MQRGNELKGTVLSQAFSSFIRSLSATKTTVSARPCL